MYMLLLLVNISDRVDWNRRPVMKLEAIKLVAISLTRHLDSSEDKSEERRHDLKAFKRKSAVWFSW